MQEQEQEQPKLKDLLEFPCSFAFKVMGENKPELADRIVEVIQKTIPGDYVPTSKPSSKGTYTAVSVTVNATNVEQIETLYKELGAIDIVRVVL
ncbi:DUF493 family protein YbeD [Photobacterium carnosum]|uniref:UPF0250 protein CIK00_18670 n=1 Tax=Photobacterium carnosum TaxID=2023717 RepID=A0A2N4UMZ1_9GAMM|nr:DUF493 family protein YbeD [Photobacterium carnosum]KAE8175834.1 hypothetical protein CIT27_16380 [Photobacterium carnosum]MCD9496274.1 DUF493 family protein [Photobacterium carnosum]MCD9500261.1 DUF493 family protein [Photobacterium carnosum]MCD9516324.1 DUF493 family protein [Photobacterium carnosum]MCD9524461.1 DUF493 family protein [Photobacterium carnosum]